MTDTRPADATAAAADEQTESIAPEVQAGAANEAELAKARQEAAELKDRLLRTLADMENLRRRTERDVADARVYGITAFARDILGVGDNMRRALDAVGPEQRTNAEPQLKALIEGVELTERELNNVLERHGVKKIPADGQKFDPNVHQAMFEVPNETVPSGTVVQVVQEGYTIADRVLRPSMVGVSKGGVKSAPVVEPAGSNTNKLA